ncbi:helix-turn-helix transcriptional regulator [uncultured Marivirga sp.]|uniref:helix-turn-helix domain-containing protein n=1 Tax=uncultured Marivirga sp. TaxID=1123707 RepID=UPI0030EF57B0|tara:strand:- start:68406 stop:68783 length:378 start_codon:yes stop_codon:yes gene_type:complete
MSIGDHIRKIRLKKGISQQFIADRIGISQSKFNRIENGKSDILLNDLLEMCQILRINYIELIQSNQSGKDNVDETEAEISHLCKEIKSLKRELLEIKEHLYSNRGGVIIYQPTFPKFRTLEKVFA